MDTNSWGLMWISTPSSAASTLSPMWYSLRIPFHSNHACSSLEAAGTAAHIAASVSAAIAVSGAHRHHVIIMFDEEEELLPVYSTTSPSDTPERIST